jgi:hypothetical protein
LDDFQARGVTVRSRPLAPADAEALTPALAGPVARRSLELLGPFFDFARFATKRKPCFAGLSQ